MHDLACLFRGATQAQPDLLLEAGASYRSGRRRASGREIVWWPARRPAGMTLRQLGEKAGRADYAAVGMVLKRYELKMKKDPAISTETQMLERELLKVDGLLPKSGKAPRLDL